MCKRLLSANEKAPFFELSTRASTAKGALEFYMYTLILVYRFCLQVFPHAHEELSFAVADKQEGEH